VQRELERMIAVGELKGGDRINESALALKLGISRGPIREACRAFEQTGVLRSEINRGFFVREITMKEALDIYDLRAQLGGMAGRLAAASVTGAQLEELESLVNRMDAAVTAEDVGAYYPLNVEFHTRLIACADNHKLEASLQEISAAIAGEKERRRSDSEALARHSAQIRELQAANDELVAANDRLQGCNDEYVLSNEEGQASTEEIETLNEEFQATNEELETLNEEFQATIEELNTTNEDLEARGRELGELARVADAERERLSAVLISINMSSSRSCTVVLNGRTFQKRAGDDSPPVSSVGLKM